jgi:hypothetical protein
MSYGVGPFELKVMDAALRLYACCGDPLIEDIVIAYFDGKYTPRMFEEADVDFWPDLSPAQRAAREARAQAIDEAPLRGEVEDVLARAGPRPGSESVRLRNLAYVQCSNGIAHRTEDFRLEFFIGTTGTASLPPPPGSTLAPSACSSSRATRRGLTVTAASPSSS